MTAVLTSSAGVFAQLVESGKVGAVTLAIEDAISKSFVTHPMRHMTQSEVKRRFDMCAKIFAKLRGDLKWGIQRAMDHLPGYLAAELGGINWTPADRSCWMPGDD